jgi:fructose-1,6-bisphosphatase I
VTGRPAASPTPTLAEHLRALEAPSPPLAPDLAVVLETLAEAGARLAREIGRAALTSSLGETGAVNQYGDRVRRLDVLAQDLLLAALRESGVVSVVASEELATPVVWPRAGAGPGLAVCLDPLDGSLNADVAGITGTIFGIRPGPGPGEADPARTVLAAGTRQVAAGYLVYGAGTVFVYAAGAGAHAFVQDPADGQFRLTHARLRTPPAGQTYAVNDANWPRWGPAPRALVEGLRRAAAAGAGQYALRYSGALAGDFHRALLEGGIYLYPEDSARPGGRIRLLYEAAPLALVAEAAGGRASTGRGRILDVVATDYHQRTPLYIGSAEEVRWAERCYRESSG